MISKNYNILDEMLDELYQELAEINRQIQFHLRCIKEADAYVESIEKKDTDDFAIFSPSKNSEIHKYEIQKTADEKISHEKENKDLFYKREVLTDRIGRLEKISVKDDYELKLINLQEKEKDRIARKLQDTLLQDISHLLHKAELCSMYVEQNPVKAKEEISVISELLQDSIDEVRNIIYDLRPIPFDNMDLKAAIENIFDDFNKNHHCYLDLEIENVPCENNVILISIYRIIQESISNLETHSDIKTVVFSCKAENRICKIDFLDDGSGEEDSKVNTNEYLDISFMRERVKLLNGTISIESSAEKGNSVHIEVPLEEGMSIC